MSTSSRPSSRARPTRSGPSSVRRTAVAVGIGWLAATAPSAFAQQAAAAGGPTVIVTGSVQGRALEDAPYAAGVVGREALESGGPMVHLSESLARVPGLVAANRSNYAQDLQISSRGFGARASFGVRGIRLYADGIPATGPDGQGQVSHFDLDGAARVEVLRGPFSVLFGNASGGVINVIAAPIEARAAQGSVEAAENGFGQLRASYAQPGSLAFRLSGSTLRSEGFRPKSEARRDLVHARAELARGEEDRYALVLSHLEQPADDPLGLTRAQFNADPLSTAAVATQFDTRKSTRQSQAGLKWNHRFGETGVLREAMLSAYAGQRRVLQWLAIPPTTQLNPRHGGGVVDLDRDYAGGELRIRAQALGAAWLAGLVFDQQRDQRKGFDNYTGPAANPTALGVTGNLRRDETNEATSTDAFVQAQWALADTLEASAGLRGGRIVLQASDAFLANGNDSGRREFTHAQPVAGLSWRVLPQLHLHAAAARGFEAPTLAELAYRPDGTGGLNTALQPQKSRQFEVGAKWRSPVFSADLALFDIEVSNEIGVATNAGGRASFTNVGRTKRRGAELAASVQPIAPLTLSLAATALQARYRDSFLACAGIPCTAPTVRVPAGNRIAGTQRGSVWAEAAWRDATLGQFALEGRAVGGTVVDDRNSDGSGRYDLLAVRWSKGFTLGAGTTLEVLARIDNLTDERYVGSVIVGEGNGRFFEPGAPRTAFVSLRFGWR